MRKVALYFLLLLLCICPAFAKVSEASQAFGVSISRQNDGLNVSFKLANKDIFIYKNSFNVYANQQKITQQIHLPKGIEKDNYTIIDQDFSFFLPPSLWQDKAGSLRLEYQGCSKGGICYKPQSKTYAISNLGGGLSATLVSSSSKTPEDSSFTKAFSLFTSANDAQIADMLSSKTFLLSAGAFFIYGLMLSFTPCMLPMLPILSGIIIARSGKGAAVASAVYVLAMALAYAGLGAGAGALGGGLAIWLQSPFVIGFMALVFVILAANMFGAFEINLPAINGKFKSGGLLGVAFMGVAGALVVSPCVAAPLAGALLFISRSGDAIFGASMLFIMGLGMGASLFAFGLGVKSVAIKPGAWMIKLKQAFGFIMLAMALWLAGRLLAGELVLVGWGVLGLFASVWLGLFESGISKLLRSCLVVLALYSALLFAGGLAGATNALSPLSPFGKGAIAEDKFKPLTVTSLAELGKEMAGQNAIMLDFWASWCVSCLELDEKTLSEQSVQEALRGVKVIKVDLSKASKDAEELLNEFNLAGPPALLFYKNAKEIRQARIIGFVNAQSLAQTLKEIYKP